MLGFRLLCFYICSCGLEIVFEILSEWVGWDGVVDGIRDEKEIVLFFYLCFLLRPCCIIQ